VNLLDLFFEGLELLLLELLLLDRFFLLLLLELLLDLLLLRSFFLFFALASTPALAFTFPGSRALSVRQSILLLSRWLAGCAHQLG